MLATKATFWLSVAILPYHAWTVRVIASEEEDRNIKVEVLFVRHGHACHNALSYHTDNIGPIKTGKVKHAFYSDPPLTDCGLLNSEVNGHELRAALGDWNPQFVGSSSMVRAMETAIAMFPGHKVVPLPFIPEDALGAANSPKPLEEQKVLLPNDAINWHHMETDIELQDDRVEAFNHKKHYSANEAREKVKYREFRAFLGEKIVPGLLPAVIDQHHVLRLAIVAHSHFLKAKLKKYFKCEVPGHSMPCHAMPSAHWQVKFNNNEARLVTYSYNVDSHRLTELNSDIPSVNCRDPVGRKPYRSWGKEKKYACAQDYARCMSFNAKAMGVADGRPGDQSPWIKAPLNGEECCLAEGFREGIIGGS